MRSNCVAAVVLAVAVSSGSVPVLAQTPDGKIVAHGDGHAFVYVVTGDARVEVRGFTQTTSLIFTPTLFGAKYFDTAQPGDLDYINYSLPLDVRRIWQQGSAEVEGGYTRSSTRAIDVIDPNAPVTAPNRTVSVTDYQERWFLTPSFQYRLTPQDQLALNLDYSDITFTQAELTRRSDYTASSAEFSWNHTLTQQSIVSLGVNGSGFQANQPFTDIDNDTLTYGMTLGYQYQLNDTASVGGSAGASRSDIKIFVPDPIAIGQIPCLDPDTNQFTSCTRKSSDNNFIGQVFYRQRTEQTITTEVSLSRSIEPNSDGSQVTLDVARVYFTKNLNSLDTANLGGVYTRQEAVGSQGGTLSQRFSRDYISIEFGVRHRFDRNWAVHGEYTYTEDKQTAGVTYSVPNHRLNFSIEFAGLGSH